MALNQKEKTILISLFRSNGSANYKKLNEMYNLEQQGISYNLFKVYIHLLNKKGYIIRLSRSKYMLTEKGLKAIALDGNKKVNKITIKAKVLKYSNILKKDDKNYSFEIINADNGTYIIITLDLSNKTQFNNLLDYICKSVLSIYLDLVTKYDIYIDINSVQFDII